MWNCTLRRDHTSAPHGPCLLAPAARGAQGAVYPLDFGSPARLGRLPRCRTRRKLKKGPWLSSEQMSVASQGDPRGCSGPDSGSGLSRDVAGELPGLGAVPPSLSAAPGGRASFVHVTLSKRVFSTLQTSRKAKVTETYSNMTMASWSREAGWRV